MDVVPALLGYAGVNSWEDSNGYGCSFYYDYSCFPDTGAATKFEKYGMTASDACCICGGGMNGYSTTTVTTMSETSTTSSYCEDWRPSSEDHWYVGATSQDCGYLAYFCSEAIASVASFGHTASEACCDCGGGTGFTSTQTTVTSSSSSSTSTTSTTTDITYTFTSFSSTETTPSTSASTPTSYSTSSSTSTTASTVTRCEDWVPLMIGLTEIVWYDSGGTVYTCDFYESNNLCGTGEDVENFGRTADEACCACGGGVNAMSTSTETATTTTLCVDMVPDGAGAYWYDSRGTLYTCSYYAHADFCTSEAPSYPNFGHTAQEVCCTCSGGTGKTVTNTTLTASSTISTSTSTVSSTLSHTSSTSMSTASVTFTPTTWSSTSSATATTSSHTSSTSASSSSTSSTTASDTSSWSETSTSTVTLSSSTSVTVSTTTGTDTTATSCDDYVPEGNGKWYDPLGEMYDCEWYARHGGEHCGEFASVQNPAFGTTANEACCVCGGGAPRTETTTVTVPLTTQCFDRRPAAQEYWSDGRGNTCRYYERELLVMSACSESENFGMTAREACCVCGGGIEAGNETFLTVTSTTTSATTLPATSTLTALPAAAAHPAAGAEDTEARSLPLAAALALSAAGLLVAGAAGLLLQRSGRGCPRRAPRAHGEGAGDATSDPDAPFVV